MLALGVVFFLSLFAVACLLAAVWGVRALWAKLTGLPVSPWVMPMRAATNWASMAQRAGNFGDMAGHSQAASKEESAPFTPSAGTKRGGILAQVAGEVSDVQAREVH